MALTGGRVKPFVMSGTSLGTACVLFLTNRYEEQFPGAGRGASWNSLLAPREKPQVKKSAPFPSRCYHVDLMVGTTAANSPSGLSLNPTLRTAEQRGGVLDHNTRLLSQSSLQPTQSPESTCCLSLEVRLGF